MQGAPQDSRVTYLDASEAIKGGLNELGWGIYSRLVRYASALAALAVLIPIGIVALLLFAAFAAAFAHWISMRIGAASFATWLDHLGSRISDPGRFWFELPLKSSLYGTGLIAALWLPWIIWPNLSRPVRVLMEPYDCTVSDIKERIETYRDAFNRKMRSGSFWAWLNVLLGASLISLAAPSLTTSLQIRKCKSASHLVVSST